MEKELWNEILQARTRIAPFSRETPVMTSSSIDRVVGNSCFFKCENFQRTGSFKFRGAVNAVASLPSDRRVRGVVTHSSGNHGQALALAAREFRIPAFIVIPDDAPRVKLAAAQAYGGKVIPCAPTQKAREETARRVAEETGAVFVDSHDDPAVIAGQGTTVIELLEETSHLDVILVPIGGGGLISGTVVAVENTSPGTEVIGCEPVGADDAYRSLEEGRRITDFTPRTIADGLRTPLGRLTYAIIKEKVGRIIRVGDEEIIAAMRMIWERMKIVVEPSSAVALAPLLSGGLKIEGKRVGVILTGGNVDLDRFFWFLRDRS